MQDADRTCNAVTGLTASTMLADRRVSERQPVDVLANVLSCSDRYLFTCKVCDISETGARIQSDRVGTLPLKFKLYIEDPGLLVLCRIVWCRAGYAGLKFVDDPTFHLPQSN